MILSLVSSSTSSGRAERLQRGVVLAHEATRNARPTVARIDEAVDSGGFVAVE
jgi:hypothetical protein